MKGKFVFDKRKILEVVEKAEAEALLSKLNNQHCITWDTPKLEYYTEDTIENIPQDSEDNCIIVATHR